jgi:glycosyltransferase involved in cell wall biosynthesis
MIPYVLRSQFSLTDTMVYRLKVKSACKRADHLIAISHSTKSDMVSILNIDAPKISVCYQSCDEVFQQALPQEINKQYLLYVGSINERKGLCDIVEAYALSPDELPKMIVIGEGGAYKQKALHLIAEKKLKHKFDFKGTVPNKDLVDYYRNAFALVLPSMYEGFGIPIVEALYTGCAVICYDNSSLPEAAGPGGLLVKTGNIAALNRAMVDIKKIHIDLAKVGYKYVVDRFNTQKSISDYIRLYEEQMSTHQNNKYP